MACLYIYMYTYYFLFALFHFSNGILFLPGTIVLLFSIDKALTLSVAKRLWDTI